MRYLIIILWLLLGFLYWYLSRSCCTPSVAPVKEAAVVPANVPCPQKGVLSYSWSQLKPTTSNTWTSFKDSIISSVTKDQILQITGLYRAKEENKSSFDNLGMARADDIRTLMGLKAEDVKLNSREVTLGKLSQDCAFNGITFRNLVNTANVKEIDDRTLIYFPFNSTNKLSDAEVESYLDDVVERVKKSGERIRLTGHTDDVGEDDANISLGQRRADIIKQYLVSKGVAQNKIIAQSKGESSPMASNDNENGRAKNRRTELQIIK